MESRAGLLNPSVAEFLAGVPSTRPITCQSAAFRRGAANDEEWFPVRCLSYRLGKQLGKPSLLARWLSHCSLKLAERGKLLSSSCSGLVARLRSAALESVPVASPCSTAWSCRPASGESPLAGSDSVPVARPGSVAPECILVDWSLFHVVREYLRLERPLVEF